MKGQKEGVYDFYFDMANEDPKGFASLFARDIVYCWLNKCSFQEFFDWNINLIDEIFQMFGEEMSFSSEEEELKEYTICYKE